jgi:hypothetical protein
MATGNTWNFTGYIIIPEEKENDIRCPLTSRQKQLDLFFLLSFLLMGYKCIWRGGKKG